MLIQRFDSSVASIQSPRLGLNQLRASQEFLNNLYLFSRMIKIRK